MSTSGKIEVLIPRSGGGTSPAKVGQSVKTEWIGEVSIFVVYLYLTFEFRTASQSSKWLICAIWSA